MAIQILPVLLNADYDRGSDFGPRVVRNRFTTPARRATEIVLSPGRFYGGSVSYSPLVDDGTPEGPWQSFLALWSVCAQGGFGCLFWDHKEHALADEPVGTGDGSNREFQIRKAFTVGGQTVYRTIRRPIHNSLTVVANGVSHSNTLEIKVGGVADANWTVDEATGLLTFDSGHAPAAGAEVTVSGEFVVPVVFEDEVLDVRQRGANYYVRALRLLEVAG